MAPPANVSLMDSATASSGGASATSSSLSPGANALLLVAGTAAHSISDLSVSSVTDTLTGTGSWTIRQRQSSLSSRFVTWWAWAVAGASPGSGTITVNFSPASLRYAVAWMECVNGFDSGSPETQFDDDAGTGDISISLATPATQAMCIGAFGSRNDGDGITPGSGFSEIVDIDSGGMSTQARLQAEYDNSSPDGVVDVSGMGTLNNLGVALEIAPDVVPSSLIIPRIRVYIPRLVR